MPSPSVASSHDCQHFTLVVDLDERGHFKAHVDNANGKSVFDFSNEDETGWPSSEGIPLVADGYMKHGRDVIGLLDYLQVVGIAGNNASLSCVG